jgi:hypothetical protein
MAKRHTPGRTQPGGAKPCSCGSGRTREELLDARGIFCCYVCPSCEAEKRRDLAWRVQHQLGGPYRPEVLSDPGYEAKAKGGA